MPGPSSIGSGARSRDQTGLLGCSGGDEEGGDGGEAGGKSEKPSERPSELRSQSGSLTASGKDQPSPLRPLAL